MNNNEEKELEIKDEEIGDTQTPSEVVDDNQEQPTHEEEVVEDAVEDQIEENLEENTENLEEEVVEETPKMFDQNYVNDLVGRTRMEAREKAMRAMYDKYGVENDEELDGIFGKGQRYDLLNDNFNDVNQRYSNVMAENALLKSKTDESRWDDIRLILTGKGLDITPENIAMELVTHPEWMQTPVQPDASQGNVLTQERAENIVNNPVINNKPAAQIKRFGSDVPSTEETNDEEAFMSKYFNI